jgi:2-polyprenyl-3-methyl-5-hydroxy-6-metoxy-1,4-benzoquinol methylase
MADALDAFLARTPREQGVYRVSDAAAWHTYSERQWRRRARQFELFSDSALRALPRVAPDHPQAARWRERARAADRLAEHLSRQNRLVILEVGCGAGWLTHRLAVLRATAELRTTRVWGIDVNERDLRQAARVFVERPSAKYLLADVLTADLPAAQFTTIVLVDTLQHLVDPVAALSRCLTLLRPGGEIHLLDGPIWRAPTVAAARHRMTGQLAASGLEWTLDDLSWPTWHMLRPFRPEVLLDPSSTRQWLERLWRPEQAPRPWVVIRR